MGGSKNQLVFTKGEKIWDPFLSCALLHFCHTRLDGPCPNGHLGGCSLLRKFRRAQAALAVITSLFHLKREILQAIICAMLTRSPTKQGSAKQTVVPVLVWWIPINCVAFTFKRLLLHVIYCQTFQLQISRSMRRKTLFRLIQYLGRGLIYAQLYRYTRLRHAL